MNISRCVLILLTTLAAAMVALAQGDAKPVEAVKLAPKFEPGSSATYVATITSGRNDREGENGSSRSVMDSKVELTVTRRVTEVSNDAISIELTYNRILISNRTEFAAMEFDTDWPEEQDADNVLAFLVRPLVNKPVRIRVTALGQFLSIRLPDGIVPPGASRQTADDLMGDSTIRDLFGPLFTLGRSGAVTKVGDSWSRKENVELTPFAKLIVERTETLESIDRGSAFIEVKGKVTMHVEEGQTEELPELKSSSIDGTIVWDLERGMLRDYDISQRVQAQRTEGDLVSIRTDESLTSIRLVE